MRFYGRRAFCSSRFAKSQPLDPEWKLESSVEPSRVDRTEKLFTKFQGLDCKRHPKCKGLLITFIV